MVSARDEANFDAVWLFSDAEVSLASQLPDLIFAKTAYRKDNSLSHAGALGAPHLPCFWQMWCFAKMHASIRRDFSRAEKNHLTRRAGKRSAEI